MKLLTILFAILFSPQDSIPPKPSEEFEIKIDYKFKQRPTASRDVVKLDETIAERDSRSSGALLPYLKLHVKMLKLAPEEIKYLVRSNKDTRSSNKKLTLDTDIVIDLGFMEDVKDQVESNEYVIEILSPEKKVLSQIVIHIDEDGLFLVNGQKRGKF